MVKTAHSLWSLPLAASLLVLGAAATPPALAQPVPPAAAAHGMGPAMGPGMGMGMGMGAGIGMHGHRFAASPEHMGRMIDHMLDGLNASDAQRTQIKQIVAAAAADMKTQGSSARGLHQKAMQIFTAPTVDAAAAEQLRQQMLQQHEQMSRRMTQAMVDIARVLTPEQRLKVGERMRDRESRMEDRRKRMERERPGR
ncbi:MAG: Spy/CpxP family protein refolding chaperone [Pseudomonadota bacterium]|nr:Spy/CpxP family protein refolding chaperone [Pseudomonadota bacterium]